MILSKNPERPPGERPARALRVRRKAADPSNLIRVMPA